MAVKETADVNNEINEIFLSFNILLVIVDESHLKKMELITGQDSYFTYYKSRYLSRKQLFFIFYNFNMLTSAGLMIRRSSTVGLFVERPLTLFCSKVLLHGLPCTLTPTS